MRKLAHLYHPIVWILSS